jgi:hypothetical protein
MAKFHGKIGYSESVETAPGVWLDQITEREYYGDVIRELKQITNSGQVNDNFMLNNRLSITADDFAYTNFSAMKYVVWYGVYWKVGSVEIQRPRMILSLGGVYNGVKA